MRFLKSVDLPNMNCILRSRIKATHFVYSDSMKSPNEQIYIDICSTRLSTSTPAVPTTTTKIPMSRGYSHQRPKEVSQTKHNMILKYTAYLPQKPKLSRPPIPSTAPLLRNRSQSPLVTSPTTLKPIPKLSLSFVKKIYIYQASDHGSCFNFGCDQTIYMQNLG